MSRLTKECLYVLSSDSVWPLFTVTAIPVGLQPTLGMVQFVAREIRLRKRHDAIPSKAGERIGWRRGTGDALEKASPGLVKIVLYRDVYRAPEAFTKSGFGGVQAASNHRLM